MRWSREELDEFLGDDETEIICDSQADRESLRNALYYRAKSHTDYVFAIFRRGKTKLLVLVRALR